MSSFMFKIKSMKSLTKNFPVYFGVTKPELRKQKTYNNMLAIFITYKLCYILIKVHICHRVLYSKISGVRAVTKSDYIKHR